MTGEITLRGRVLPVGGLREKVLAAHRAGIKTVIIPKKNEKDLVDIPKRARNDLNIQAVEHMDEVLKIAMLAKQTRTQHRGKDSKPKPPVDIHPAEADL